jgi:hypothetical protein
VCFKFWLILIIKRATKGLLRTGDSRKIFKNTETPLQKFFASLLQFISSGAEFKNSRAQEFTASEKKLTSENLTQHNA